MPEINPLTNNQIFLKKIAENTGSNYETGDVSEINPLTTDQIFLKEIAENTAGQAGDLTELEGKVADNTSAIEAIEGAIGAKNILPITLSYVKVRNTQGTWNNNVYTINGLNIEFTENNDIVTAFSINGTSTAEYNLILTDVDDATKWSGDILRGIPSDQNGISLCLNMTHSPWTQYARDTGNGAIIGDIPSSTSCTIFVNIINGDTINNATVYPMISIVMTNRELTDNCSRYLDLSKYSITPLATDYVNRHSWTCPADGAYFFRSQNDSDGSHAIKLTLYVGASNNEIFNHNSNISEDLYVCIDSPVFYLKKDTEIQYLSDRSTSGNGGGVFVIRLN